MPAPPIGYNAEHAVHFACLVIQLRHNPVWPTNNIGRKWRRKGDKAMNDILSRIDSSDLATIIGVTVLVTVIVIGVGVVLVGVIWFKLRQEEIRSNLKREMLDRGMSAEDIKTVLEAGPKPRPIQTDALPPIQTN